MKWRWISNSNLPSLSTASLDHPLHPKERLLNGTTIILRKFMKNRVKRNREIKLLLPLKELLSLQVLFSSKILFSLLNLNFWPKNQISMKILENIKAKNHTPYPTECLYTIKSWQMQESLLLLIDKIQ